MSARRRHHKVERLGERAQQIIADGLVSGASYEVIAEKVRTETGATIAPSSIQRYAAAKYMPQMEAAQRAQAVADRLFSRFEKMGDSDIARFLRVEAAERLQPVLAGLQEEAPAELAKLFTKLDSNRIEEQRIAQRERELEERARRAELESQRLELQINAMRAAAERVKGVVEGKRPRPDDVRRAVLALWNISTSDAPAPATEAGGPPSPSPGGGTVGGPR